MVVIEWIGLALISIGLAAIILLLGLCWWQWRRLRKLNRSVDRQFTQLIQADIQKDEISRQLAERTLEIKDLEETLRDLSTQIEIQTRVDEVEKEQVDFLKQAVVHLKGMVESLVDVRKDGNGQAENASVVLLMLKVFLRDSDFCQFCTIRMDMHCDQITLAETLIDKCADLYWWAQSNGKMGKLMRSLRAEYPHIEWS